jgi:Amt family ammonium transporter
MILTGVLAEDIGLISGETTLFFRHLIALLAVAVFTFGLSYVLYMVVDRVIPMRVRSDQEQRGLDHSQHGERLN